jgi:hypothetical protein
VRQWLLCCHPAAVVPCEPLITATQELQSLVGNASARHAQLSTPSYRGCVGLLPACSHSLVL